MPIPGYGSPISSLPLPPQTFLNHSKLLKMCVIIKKGDRYVLGWFDIFVGELLIYDPTLKSDPILYFGFYIYA